MKTRSTFFLTAASSVAVLALFSLSACSEGTGDEGMGGAASTGGGSATGGATGATGGETGSGGTTSTGGSTSTGGATSTSMGWTFDTDEEGWAVTFEKENGASNSGMGGAGFTSTLDHDAAEGDPDAGSLSVTGNTVVADDQTFIAVYPDPALDLTGKTLTAKVKIDSGLTSDPDTCPGGAYLYAKSGAFDNFVRGDWTNVVPGSAYVTLSFDLADPEYSEGTFDAADIKEIGVAINAGGMCAGKWEAFTAHVDSITY